MTAQSRVTLAEQAKRWSERGRAGRKRLEDLARSFRVSPRQREPRQAKLCVAGQWCARKMCRRSGRWHPIGLAQRSGAAPRLRRRIVSALLELRFAQPPPRGTEIWSERNDLPHTGG